MRRQQHIEQSGPLAGHVRQGRRFLSTLVATGVFEVGDWVRDDLPDLLWPILVLSDRGNEAARDFVRWQKATQNDLAEAAEPEMLAEGTDGRLTSLVGLAARDPKAATLIRGRAIEFGLLPPRVVKVLTTFPDRPAPWLAESEETSPDQDDLELLAQAIIQAITDGHREALIKCLPIWSAVQAGTFRTDTTTRDLLVDYPIDPATRPLADSFIRAGWGARKAGKTTADASWIEPVTWWARSFWDTNGTTTLCVRSRELELEEQASPAEGEQDESASTATEHAARLQQIAMEMVSSYIEALETSPSQLYEQERQEVHAGTVTRAGRDVIAALGAPDLWCIEHGAHIGRMLVEVRIRLAWMALQDRSIYRRCQDYGAGKAKLYGRIVQELTGEGVQQHTAEAAEEFARLSHNHSVLDHRVVDTSDSFAGTSLRQMATDTGLLDLYRQAYMVSSGVTHTEWWSVEAHCMERCLNILHRGHLIPSLQLNPGGQVSLAEAWIDSLRVLIRTSFEILETAPDAVATRSHIDPKPID